MASRKRRAPGASPHIPQQTDIPSNHYSPAAASLSADQFANTWSGQTMEGDMNALFSDPSLYDFPANLGTAGGQSNHSRVISLDGLDESPAVGTDMTSGQLVRRNPNHQLAPRGRNAWDGFDNDKQGEWPTVGGGGEDDELEQKALMARRDAQSKRKQIPPFVQKLSSFLDDNKNTNLIRWSDDGNSFIVLDEDEFARTLIPELFKHNNYASFVRQLNMYGFHKKVGLSDNSMKASELKAKAPSEYYNKYFKRGRPELLWLIQKPKNASNPKRKRDDDGKGDSEEERRYGPDTGGGGTYGEDLAVRANQDMAMIPRTEYNSLRSEVRALQQQQKAISNVLTSIRRQNDQLYQQATAFQTLHERHENSINAILTFLATFYNRSLEGGSGTNLADLFHPNITQQQPRGNVVDVDDFPDKDFGDKSSQMQMQRPNRRSLALLPAPAAKDGGTKGDRAATLSPSILSSSGGSPRPKAANRPGVFRSPAMSRSTSSSAGIGTQAANSGRGSAQVNMETPPNPHASQSLPENEEIMSHIQNINANTPQSATQAPYLDNLSAALANYQTQGGNMPLTPQQRNDMLSLMANNVSAASPNSNLTQNSNNAMVNPQPPAIPNLTEINETQNQLELLRKLSDGTSNRIQHLQERLQPLSPSGHIPGIGADSSYFDSVPLGEPAQYDLDMESFVNDDFFPSTNPAVSGATATNVQNGSVPATAGPADANLAGLNLDDLTGVGHTDAGITGINNVDLDDDDDLFGERGTNDDGGRIESLSSSATSPAATGEVVDDADDQNMRGSKRMRT